MHRTKHSVPVPDGPALLGGGTGSGGSAGYHTMTTLQMAREWSCHQNEDSVDNADCLLQGVVIVHICSGW